MKDKKKGVVEINYLSLTLLVISLLLLGSVITTYWTQESPQGIGGFVYREIQWQDQTISIMKANCGDHSGLYMNDYEVEGKVFLTCSGKDECKGEYCKRTQWKSPVLTDSMGS